MLTYFTRRLLLAIPTLLFIGLVIFLLLDLAPGDPTAQLPLTIPPAVREQIRISLGLGEPLPIRFFKWMYQFFVVEPQVLIDGIFNTNFAAGEARVLSWQTRSPVMDIVWQRIPQTLWVVGTAYVVAIIIALPIGIYSAYRQYSIFDNVGTFITMIGFSVPPFFSGVLVIVIFSVNLGWFPSIYDTTLVVHDWDSFMRQLQQMILPVMVLPLLLVMVMLFRDSLSSAFGPETGIFILMVTAIGITSWMPTARIVRGDVLALKEREFVLAARSIGTRNGKLIGRHILPNVISPIVVSATLGIANAIITESSLSFLGLGFPPDFPTWGRLLFDGVDYMQQYPERVILPGLAISLTVLSVNYLGDGLRDALDPRIRGR